MSMQPTDCVPTTPPHTTTGTQGLPLPESLKATNDIEFAIKHAELVLTVVPTPFLFKSLSNIKDLLTEKHVIISCTKGILNDTLETPDDIIKRALPEKLHSRCVLSDARYSLCRPSHRHHLSATLHNVSL